jgi:hypothetical protein
MAEKGRSSQSIHPAVWPQPDTLSCLAITQDALHKAVAHGRYSAIKGRPTLLRSSVFSQSRQTIYSLVLLSGFYPC